MSKIRKTSISIFECEICKSIPNKMDLDRSEQMVNFEGLEYAFSDSYKSDRYYDHTELVLKCTNCGTYYYQYFSIDTEDAFVGGPSINQNIQRLNLFRLKEMLISLNKKENLDELNQRYNAIIKSFKYHLKEKPETIGKNLMPYIIDSLTDYYIIENDWTGLHADLLNHSMPEIVIDVLYDLILMYGERGVGGIYPFFTYYKNISPAFKEIFMPFFNEHKEDIISCLEKYNNSENDSIKSKFKSVVDSFKYYKITKEP